LFEKQLTHETRETEKVLKLWDVKPKQTAERFKTVCEAERNCRPEMILLFYLKVGPSLLDTFLSSVIYSKTCLTVALKTKIFYLNQRIIILISIL